MGLFYRPVAAPAALATAPAAAASVAPRAPAPAPAGAPAAPGARSASERTEVLPASATTLRISRPVPQQELSLGRLGLAVGFLMFLLVAGLIASVYKIQPWNSVLPSAFQLLVGAVIGAVIGEKIGTDS